MHRLLRNPSSSRALATAVSRAVSRSASTVASSSFSSSCGALVSSQARGTMMPSLKSSFGPSASGSIFQRLYSTSAEPIVINVPAMGESVSEGTVKVWNKAVGEFVDEDEVVVSLETDKITSEIRAPKAGVITELFAELNQTVKIGDRIFKLSPQAKPAAAAAAPAAEAPKKTSKKADAAAPAPAAAPTPAAAPKPAAPAAPVVVTAAGERERRVPMSPMRKRIALRLKASQNTSALLTTFQECDMSKVMEMRDEFKDEFLKRHGVKLGFMSTFVKASVNALKDMPVVNAVIEGDEIVYRDYYDISIAVATPTGLVTPALRDTDRMNLADIEKEIGLLGEKARTGKITLQDLAGGTFTISNGGVYGSLMGTPIVNPPQSAILGMHAINKRPVVVNDQIVIRPIMNLALTYDHRLLDGRDAVTFLRKIKFGVEDPRRFLLDL
eukprot:CAMPEP_0184332562 /NCGR_PEP_ID=MMETSP1089-20130417/1723_1 /TAXON_ID=38269 ORGANISM="Gloeochaete wittrockiana, Strain SAG46.84" /NCGR_SAMPLE_ID=MMETSP1089 /ASSEMBLY_ACC=CAM_ASM_000445 /LENGTH=440 /DNA_ID=CAMNT_0026655991 /DNA_START=34 /DNA_END=1356 /DNA_ORIENTATION=+